MCVHVEIWCVSFPAYPYTYMYITYVSWPQRPIMFAIAGDASHLPQVAILVLIHAHVFLQWTLGLLNWVLDWLYGLR